MTYSRRRIDEQWARETFDTIVAAQPDGSTVADTRSAFTKAYEKAITDGDYVKWKPGSREAEADALFTLSIAPLRDRRRNSLPDTLQLLRDVWADATILGDLTPDLDQAYPLGNGSDKTLRHWTIPDLERSRVKRYRVAADATKAAAEYDDVVQNIIDGMERAKVDTIGETIPEVTDE